MPDWLEIGRWLVNQVDVTSDRCRTSPVGAIADQRLPLAGCDGRGREPAAADPAPTETPTAVASETAAQTKPTLLPTATGSLSSCRQRSEPITGLLTLMVAVMMAVLLVVMGVLVYRRIIKRQ